MCSLVEGHSCAIGYVVVNDVFFFQAEDGIRYLVRSRGLGDVYKRQVPRVAGRGIRQRDVPGEIPVVACQPLHIVVVEEILSLIHI